MVVRVMQTKNLTALHEEQVMHNDSGRIKLGYKLVFMPEIQKQDIERVVTEIQQDIAQYGMLKEFKC